MSRLDATRCLAALFALVTGLASGGVAGRGIVVTEVSASSSADRAGIRAFDTVVAWEAETPRRGYPASGALSDSWDLLVQ